jgi:hypothetical protein
MKSTLKDNRIINVISEVLFCRPRTLGRQILFIDSKCLLTTHFSKNVREHHKVVSCFDEDLAVEQMLIWLAILVRTFAAEYKIA